MIVCFSASSTDAQQVWNDNANRGQYKRMVATQWNDWRPDPTTILGIPKNPVGWFYWQVLHSSYYIGEDRRPYRLSGPFSQNMALLAAQYEQDKRIEDSLKNVANDNIMTYMNMTGGAGDVPYTLYYERIFDKLKNEIIKLTAEAMPYYPNAVNKFFNNDYISDQYSRFLFETVNRIETIHNEFMDKGERIAAYAKIEYDFLKYNKNAKSLLLHYIKMEKQAGRFDMNPSSPYYPQPLPTTPVTDGQIVTTILSRANY